MLVIRQKIISRSDCQANPDLLYVFGDNLERKGLGGQAKEMRGEVNAFGVATKRRPEHGTDECYMHDGSKEDLDAVIKDFIGLNHVMKNYKAVVIPTDGIGTGLALLSVKAPKLLEFINTQLNHLGE